MDIDDQWTEYVYEEANMAKTGMDPKSFSSSLPMRQVRIGESFWYREQEVVRTRILPYQWNALNDRIRSR